jgi:hypothetical protein
MGLDGKTPAEVAGIKVEGEKVVEINPKRDTSQALSEES